jgi:hypothetical protein
MHLFNKHLFFSFLITLGTAQSMHAFSFTIWGDAPAPAQPASLAQTTAQSQAPAATLAQAAQQPQPSTVALGIGEDAGIRYVMTTQFTPEEIDQYPGYEKAFALHAVSRLESENPQDMAAISHLVNRHPQFADYLERVAAYKKSKMHPTVKRDIFRAKRPIMNAPMAAQIAGMTVLGTAWESVRPKAAMQEFGVNSVSLLSSLIFEDDFRAEAGGEMRRGVSNIPKDLYEQLPTNIAVNIGTVAAYNVLTRELEERFGDPLPMPAYDPKSNNITRYSYMAIKWGASQIVCSLIAGFIVAPIINTTTSTASTVKDAINGPIDVLSGMDNNNW